MLHYTAGAVHVVVKHEHEGDESTDLPLLTGVPLGAPFDFSDAGQRERQSDLRREPRFAARDRGRPAPAGLPPMPPCASRSVPTSRTASDSDPGPADGARVTFSTATTTSGPVVPLP